MSRILSVALTVWLCAFGWARAADVSADEVKKQNEFRKLYLDPAQLDKTKALAALDGATHPSTWELLVKVAREDASKDVRFAAFKMLCGMPARNLRLAEALASLFAGVKPSASELRLKYAEEMGKSEFKYPVFDALADYGSKLRYPELVSGWQQGNRPAGAGWSNVGGDPNIALRRQREDFEKYVEVFNKITGASITAHDKNSPHTIKQWWDENKPKVLKEDREKAQKYAAEDLAKQPRDNPLLPRSAKKKAEE